MEKPMDIAQRLLSREELTYQDRVEVAAEVSCQQAEIRRLRQFEVAYKEWSDKTDWARIAAKSDELGKHIADVLRERIERKDELLRQALTVINNSVSPNEDNANEVAEAIKQELT